jgi:hypothetical protein
VTGSAETQRSPGLEELLSRVSADRDELFKRVSAVHVFHPTGIPGVTPRDVIALLGRDINVVPLEVNRTAWSLRDDVRIEWLERHSAASALDAARSIPDRPLTSTQKILERWLEGKPPAPDEEGLDLVAFKRVTSWLSRVSWAASQAERLKGATAIAVRRADLEAVGGTFFGRSTECKNLRELAEGNTAHRVAVLDAVGGMGKSALIARVELDLDAWKPGCNVMLVHLDFDDPDVSLRGIGLLAALTRQLAQRMPDIFSSLLPELESLERETFDVEAESVQVKGSDRERLDSLGLYLVDAAQSRLRTALADKRFQRLFLVLDTVERAMRDDPFATNRGVEWLWHVIEPFPASMMLAGRSVPVPQCVRTVAQPMKLGELELDDARDLLVDRGVPSETAVALAKSLPRRPLTMRLAARAVLETGLDVDDPSVRDAIQRALIDGYLHLRVLNHVDESLRPLVHPGFALRRFTSQLILEVLGDIVRPVITRPEEAQELFQRMRLVSELISEEGRDGELVIREEVRRELLGLMLHDRREDVTKVHARAAEVLGRATDEIDQRESAYHLRVLSGREDPDATESVERALEAWENDTARTIESLLNARQLDDAKRLLAQREERSAGSPLFVLEARLHRLLGNPERAEESVARALATRRNPTEEDPLRRVRAWAAASNPDVQLAEVDLARETAYKLERVEAQLASLNDLAAILSPRRDSEGRRALWSLEDEIASLFDSVADETLREDRGLLSGCAAHLHRAARLRRAVRLGVLDRIRDPNMGGLAVLLRTLPTGEGGVREWLGDIARVETRNVDPYPAKEVANALGRVPTSLAKAAEVLLDSRGDERTVETVRELIARDTGDTGVRSPAVRLAAMKELEEFLRLHQQELPLWFADGATLLSLSITDVDPDLIVAAADRTGAFDALFDVLFRSTPGSVGELSLIRSRLMRQPAFQHFPHEEIIKLHGALVASGRLDIVFKALEGSALEDVLRPSDGDPTGTAVFDLLDVLVIANETERLGTVVPLQQVLERVQIIDISPEANKLIAEMIDEMSERSTGFRGARVQPSELEAVQGKVTPPPDFVFPAATFLKGARALSAIASLRVPLVTGGRIGIDALGKQHVAATAWLVTDDLLLTTFHGLNTDKPDEADLHARASASVVNFEGPSTSSSTIAVHGLVAYDESLDFALLRVDRSEREPLRVSLDLAPPDTPVLLPHLRASDFAVSIGKVIGRAEDTLHHSSASYAGAGGAPLCLSDWGVIGIHRGWVWASHAGKYGQATSMTAILNKLARDTPQIVEEIRGSTSV